MEEEGKTKFMNRAINEEILAKLSLKNRYAFLNTNLMTILEQKQIDMLEIPNLVFRENNKVITSNKLYENNLSNHIN